MPEDQLVADLIRQQIDPSTAVSEYPDDAFIVMVNLEIPHSEDLFPEGHQAINQVIKSRFGVEPLLRVIQTNRYAVSVVAH
jgi:hypothetical protein